jgi:phage terminase large subunit
VVVAHRRAGKTVACVLDLVLHAARSVKPNARYAYIAPFYSQAKQAAWDYLKQHTRDLAVKVSESELSVELPNGARIRLYGADNPDALRGIYLDGVVLDEYADMRPSVWGEIIRPLLADRRGWAVFIGTPKGKNAFYELWKAAKDDPEWYSLTLKASETGLLDAAELISASKTMTEEQYQQEFECSFDAAILGAIYAKEIANARRADRIGRVPYEPGKLVHTAWDIGQGDATAIWFYQWVKQELHVIDFYEATGEKLPHYVSILKNKPYSYETHWLPHDAEHEHVEAEKTFKGGLMAHNMKAQIVPNIPLDQGINQGRLALAKAYIDEKNCAPGLEALAAYRWDYNDRMAEFKTRPVHDWASHAADAWRYLALSLKSEQKPMKIKYDLRGYV